MLLMWQCSEVCISKPGLSESVSLSANRAQCGSSRSLWLTDNVDSRKVEC